MVLTKFGKTYEIEFWKGDILSSPLSIDTETELISSPSDIPRLVLTTAFDGKKSVIIRNEDLLVFLQLHNTAIFQFWNAAFDIPVIQKQTRYSFHEKLISNLIDDGQILYRLLSIATTGREAHKWGLAAATLELLNEELEKSDATRLTFGQFLSGDGVRYDKIPVSHLQYACLDAISTYLCCEQILKKITPLPTSTKLAQNINLLGDIALAQVTRNGISLDLSRVEKIKGEFENMKQHNAEVLASYGYVRGKKGNTKIFEDLVKREKFDLPLTAKGRINSSKKYLQPYCSHPFIRAYLDFKGFEKQKNFLAELNAPRIHPRYSTIKVTSRTSATKPNIQQMPRVGGIRECFIPAEGNVFIDCDYSMIELVAIAAINQKLFKHSVMANLLNDGKDLHKYGASKIYKVPEDQVTKDQRQVAKILNFGLVANMSPATFVGHASKFGVFLTLDEAVILKQEWAKVFPEMEKYWRRGYGKSIVITDTGYVRNNCEYTAYLNTPMQLKVAEGAKLMLYFLMQSGYKVVAFIHDQVLVEHPIEGAEKALEEVKKIMIQSMEKVIVGVKVSVDGKIKTCFQK